MNYLLLIALITLVFIFFVLPKIVFNNKQSKQLKYIRSIWGVANDDFRNFDWIEQFSKIKKDNPFHLLPQQVISDIDLDAVFSYLDRTISKPGQQYFYAKLLRPTNDIKSLQEFDELVEYSLANTEIRETIQLELFKLSKPDAYYISSLLKENIYQKPSWANWLKVDTVIVIAMMILSVKFHVLLIFLMIPFALNMMLHLWNKNKSLQFVQSLPQLNLLIDTAKKINIENKIFAKEDLTQNLVALKKFQQKFSLLGFKSNSVSGDLTQAFLFGLEAIKALFLIEVNSFLTCMEELKDKREHILKLFEFVGNIDAAIAVASLRVENKTFCKPEFTSPGKRLLFVNIFHPLIDDCVANSLNIDQKSILITGSNMSGKTTFIRTIAINSVLAQTIYTCFADKFATPIMKLLSSIRIDDNLLEGKSYFFEEVNTIQTLLVETTSPFQNLFVLDEVFKGTNTVERVAAAKAVLHYLNQKENIVLVSTHDLELSELLKDSYDLYHFEEQIINDTLTFDHLLKHGKLKTTNAIQLLELSGYPKQIIDEAKAAVKAERNFDQKNN